MRKSTAIILLLTAWQLAADSEESRREISSPDKRFSAVITHSSSTPFAQFAIYDTCGKVLFSSDTAPKLQETFESYSDGALWSPDCEILAIACGYDKHKETYLFVRRVDEFVVVSLPDLTENRDNPWILPVRWLSRRRLVLDVSGPHAGHPGTYFKGRATVRASPKFPRCEILYRHVTDTTYDE